MRARAFSLHTMKTNRRTASIGSNRHQKQRYLEIRLGSSSFVVYTSEKDRRLPCSSPGGPQPPRAAAAHRGAANDGGVREQRQYLRHKLIQTTAGIGRDRLTDAVIVKNIIAVEKLRQWLVERRLRRRTGGAARDRYGALFTGGGCCGAANCSCRDPRDAPRVLAPTAG